MKRIVFSMLICFLGFNAFAQKTIENPKFTASTSSYVTVTRIELQDTCTILSFKVIYPAGQTVSIAKGSYIQPNSAGDQLLMTRAEGYKITDPIIIPKGGEISYRLFFPRIDPSVTSLDFGEGGSVTGDAWFIFGLEIAPKTHVKLLPESIAGNWYTTDGSRQWMYGISDNEVIYNSCVYFKPALSQEGKTYKLLLNKEGKQQAFYMKPAPDNNLLIGTDPKKLVLYSRSPVIKADYKFPDDDEFGTSVFKSDTAIYQGYVKGYVKQMGSPGKIITSDVLSAGFVPLTLPMAEDGTFTIKIPLNHPQSVTVMLYGIYTPVFLEPGKTTFQVLDLLSKTNPEAGSKGMFMGEGARINDDTEIILPVLKHFRAALLSDKMETPLYQYRDSVLAANEKRLDSLSNFIKTCPISKKALQLVNLKLSYEAVGQILNYKTMMSYNSRNPANKSAKPFIEPDSTFYTFIIHADLNNPLAPLSGSVYSSLASTLGRSNFMMPQGSENFRALRETIRMKGVKISDDNMAVLDTIIMMLELKTPEKIGAANISKWTEMSKNYKTLADSVNQAIILQKTYSGLKNYLDLEPGLFSDLIFYQQKISFLASQPNPFSPSEENSIRQLIRTPFIKDYLLAKNELQRVKLETKLRENKTKTGYFLNETPKVKNEELFAAITEKYKGKVVFVDFWATWCGPCKAAIERMKPLKEEYKDKDLVFIYFTDPSSPEDLFSMMIPDIKGQHYKLNKDQQKFIYDFFKVKSIPRYILIGKNGKIVTDDVGAKAYANEDLKILFDEQLKQ